MADNSIKIKKGSAYEKFTDPFYLNTFIEFYHTHSNEECQAEYNITHSTMYRIIKQFNGNVLGIGLDEKILKQINKNLFLCLKALQNLNKQLEIKFYKLIKILLHLLQ